MSTGDSAPPTVPDREVRRLQPEAWERCRTAAPGLTRFFAELLPHLVAQTFDSSGEVWVAGEVGEPEGILLLQPAERSATVFVRTPEAAEALLAHRGPLVVFSEIPLGGRPYEPFAIYDSELPRPNAPGYRFTHPVRLATPSDGPVLLDLLREGLGAVDERWFRPLPAPPERGFVAEHDGQIVGAAWVAVPGPVARLHSLVVRPRYRGLGVGRDLWAVRARWAEAHGARHLRLEVAEGNGPSRAIAEAAGMQAIGRIFRTAWGEPGPFSSEGPRTGGRPSLSSP